MMSSNNSDEIPNKSESSPSSQPPQETGSSPAKETIAIEQGGFPWIIRYMIHFIIWWGVFYVLYQPESNYINYINAVLLVSWSTYSLLAAKKKWPPFP